MYHRSGVITFMAYALPAMLDISLAPYEVAKSLGVSLGDQRYVDVKTCVLIWA
jgi:hypothetical protein